MAASMVFPTRQISMLFEPGPQANMGKWEGMETDKAVLDWMRVYRDKFGPYGGAGFWSMNDKERGPNSQKLAEYIQTT